MELRVQPVTLIVGISLIQMKVLPHSWIFLSLPVHFYYIFVEKNTSIFKLSLLYYNDLKVA